MRTSVLIFSLFATVSSASADTSLPSLSDCLPPTADILNTPSECVLTYRPAPLLRQDVRVSNCSFLSGDVEAREHEYRLMLCSIKNGSREAIESFRYGVRYFELGDDTPLAEAGFEGAHRFSSANIEGTLQPGEERFFNFVGPAIPKGVSASRLDLVVEVTGVFVPGSWELR